MNIKKLEQNLKYKFNNINLLKTALSHTSYINEKKYNDNMSNERLEFLGDSVLGVIISEELFKNYPNMPEGELTRVRSNVVCELTLKKISTRLDIGSFLYLSKGEDLNGGRTKPSMLADVFEAIVAAIYLDSSFEQAKLFVLRELKDDITFYANGNSITDFKSNLQEILQRNGDVRIEYNTIKTEGPDHNRIFTVNVSCNNKILGSGVGKSKKEAEQVAARGAINYLKK